MDQKAFHNIASSIRAVLVTSKNGLPLSNLEKDYLEITGGKIPYRSFGFPNLMSFLEMIPMVKIERNNGQLVAVSCSPATAHISKLVSEQKSNSTSRKRKKGKPASRMIDGQNQNNKSQVLKGKQNKKADINQATTVNRRTLAPLKNSNSIQSQSNNQRQVTYYPPICESKAPEILQSTFSSNAAQRKVTNYPPANRTPTSVASNPTSSPNNFERKVTFYPPINESQPSETIKSTISSHGETKYESPLEPEIQNIQWVKELRNLAENNYWHKPKYTTICMTTKLYYAMVSIGGFKFKSYPKQAESEAEAKNIVARIALNSLESYIQGNKSLLKRIKDIVSDNGEGIITSKMEKLYVDKYNERLPKNWLSLVGRSSGIVQKQCVILFANK